jgi:hypothetical protein
MLAMIADLLDGLGAKRIKATLWVEGREELQEIPDVALPTAIGSRGHRLGAIPPDPALNGRYFRSERGLSQ